MLTYADVWKMYADAEIFFIDFDAVCVEKWRVSVQELHVTVERRSSIKAKEEALLRR
jgi:hypothetical protein